MTNRILLLSLCLLSFLANHATLVDARKFWWQTKDDNINVDVGVEDDDVEDLDEQDHQGDPVEEDQWDDRPACSHDDLSEEDFKACIDKTFYSDHKPTKLDDIYKRRFVNQRNEEYQKEMEIRAKERMRHLKEEREKRLREEELEYKRYIELHGSSDQVDEEEFIDRRGPSTEQIRKREILEARYPPKPMLYELPSDYADLVREETEAQHVNAESARDNRKEGRKKSKMSMKGSKRGMEG